MCDTYEYSSIAHTHPSTANTPTVPVFQCSMVCVGRFAVVIVYMPGIDGAD